MNQNKGGKWLNRRYKSSHCIAEAQQKLALLYTSEKNNPVHFAWDTSFFDLGVVYISVILEPAIENKCE